MMTLIDPNFDTSDSRTVTLTATHGRDTGKLFRVGEMPPLDTVAYVLRLLAAIRLDGVPELMALFEPGERDTGHDIEGVLRLLAGCDAAAVRELMADALTHVTIAPDPKHPGMFRALRADDIKELKTLGDVLGAFLRVNVANS